MRIKMTMRQLEILLNEQKKKTTEYLCGSSYLYNSESTEGRSVPLTINRDEMAKQGMKSSFPDDFLVLKKFIVDEEAKP